MVRQLFIIIKCIIVIIVMHIQLEDKVMHIQLEDNVMHIELEDKVMHIQ